MQTKEYRIEELIDIPLFQELQDRLNVIYSFPSAIIDNDGKVHTATAWQDLCVKFHRTHPECLKACMASDKYILEHLGEAKPAVTYKCPHGLVDNATPIVIGGRHIANYFTGQFFLEPPDLGFFRAQAKKYGFDEKEYLAAVAKVPVWSKEKLKQYLEFIKGFVEIIVGMGYKNLQEMEARGAMQEKENALKEALKVAQLGTWTWDVKTNALAWSEEMYSIFGIDRESFSGDLKEVVARAIHPEDRAAVDVGNSAVAREGKPKALEYRVVWPDGSIHWVYAEAAKLVKDADGNPALLGGYAQDITERKKNEEELLKSRALLAGVVESTPDLIWTVDPVKFGLTFFNGGLREYFLQKRNTVIKAGMRPEDLFKDEERINWWRTAYTRALKEGGYSTEYSTSAGERILLASFNILKGGAGVFGVSVFGKDITERKQAEEALRESELKFKSLTELAPAGVYLTTVGGDCLYVNKLWQRMSGLTNSEAQGQGWVKGLHPEDRGIVFDNWQKMVDSGDTWGCEYRFQTPEGKITWVYGTAFPIKNPKGVITSYIGVNTDITERKLAETELKKSELKYRSLIENSSDVIFCVDADGRYQFVNRAFSAAFGKEPDYFAGKTFWDIYPKEHADQRYEGVKKVFLTGERVSLEVEVPLPEKTLYFYARIDPIRDEESKVKLALTHSTDITNNKLAEKQLRESEARFRTLIEQSPVAISLWRDGSGVYANRKFYQLFQQTEAFVGRPATDFFAQDFRAASAERTRRRALGLPVPKDFESVMLRSDGSQFPARVEIGQVQLADGWAQIAFLTDITESKAAEAERERLNKELMEKTREMERFLYITTHDLRSPLVNIQGFGQSLGRDLAELQKTIAGVLLPEDLKAKIVKLAGSRAQEALGFITGSASKMDRLLTALLTVSRLGRVELRVDTVDMNTVLKNAQASLSHQLKEAKGAVTLADLPPCRADAGFMGRIFTNILDNAIKYRVQGRAPVITVRGEINNARTVLYTVSDNGPGIKETELDKIWNIFYRGTSANVIKGEGIGLPMVKSMVEKSGGKVWVEPNAGEGLSFFVELPRGGG